MYWLKHFLSEKHRLDLKTLGVKRICDKYGHLSFSLKLVLLHFAGLNSHSPAIVLPSSAGQKVLIFPFFSL